MTRAEFQAYWRETHGPLALSLPEFRAYVSEYVQNHSFAWVPPSDADVLDVEGVVELTLNSDPAARATFFGSENYASKLRPDEFKFMDREFSQRVWGEETVLFASEKTLKLCLLFNPADRAGWVGAFAAALRQGPHWPLISGCTAYSFDTASWQTMNDGPPHYSYAAAVELGFADLDRMRRAVDAAGGIMGMFAGVAGATGPRPAVIALKAYLIHRADVASEYGLDHTGITRNGDQ